MPAYFEFAASAFTESAMTIAAAIESAMSTFITKLPDRDDDTEETDLDTNSTLRLHFRY
jgi:hypothetical protein